MHKTIDTGSSAALAVWPAAVAEEEQEHLAFEVMAPGMRAQSGTQRFVSAQGGTPEGDAGMYLPFQRQPGIGPESRTYRAGDPMRAVDWKSAAKGRGLQTKLYPQEEPAETVIVLDTAAEAYDGSWRLFDAAAAWASLAAEQAAAKGGAVRLMVTQQAAGSSSPNMDAAGGMLVKPSGDIAPLMDFLAEVSWTAGNPQTAKLLPDRLEHGLHNRSGVLLFTGDWRNGERLEQLAGSASAAGITVKIAAIGDQLIPSYAMRERQRMLEKLGLMLVWLPVPAAIAPLPQQPEGGV
ncbi:DUF58 domain-containing protein [Paenibacillus protaetiae]|uniref:DUF58 domain-containing protein n=1 Tax=Paenibacillus protaetiae TaxID=2509456 RepID=A0A4P6F9B3_9BACL|nr:DUF58 domain-containing protein [Paenibacillus protaetiae]